MKAIVQDAYGDTEVLTLQDIPRPVPGKGEVLVAVRAAGVDMGVWHYMTGLPLAARLALGFTKPRVRVRGMDLAGIVESVGPGVTRWQVGDKVFGTGTGTFAEYATARADKLESMPDTVSFEPAAAVPVSGITALQGLRGRVGVRDEVMILGAGGGVGTFAVQLAREFGARVTGVCSTGKADLVRGLGAAVIDYTREPLTGQYDLVMDIAGNRPLSTLRPLLKPNGTLVFAGGEGGGRWLGGMERQLGAALRRSGGQKFTSLVSLAKPGDLRTLRDLLATGAITPVVDRTYPLAAAADAVRALRAGEIRGKTVIIV